MKEFNEELNRDITLLKSLHAKKDKTEFNFLKLELMKKYNISKATIYREMKKEVPGFYKVPNYNPPVRSVSDREVRMVKELLFSGRQNTDIIRIMEAELGIAYNWDRFDKVRAMAEKIPDPQGPYETAFANGGHLFLITLFNTEYMAYGTYKTHSINGHNLRISRETYDIICLCFQRDNPPPGEDEKTTELREDLINYYKLKHTKERTLNAMYKNPQAPSMYAVKCMEESLEKTKLKEKEHREKSKYLLHGSKMGMIDQFYGEEYLKEPSEYQPDEDDPKENLSGKKKPHEQEAEEPGPIEYEPGEKEEIEEIDAEFRRLSKEEEKQKLRGPKEKIIVTNNFTPLKARVEKKVKQRMEEGKKLISQTIRERRRKGKSEIIEIRKYE